MNLMKRFAVPVGVVATSMAPFAAMAQTAAVDVSEATGSLAEVGTAVALIGVAMVAAISAGIAYRWVVAFLAK